MILSKELTLSDNQNLTATGVSENVIDLSAPGTPLNAPVPVDQDIGPGRPIPILVQLDADAGGTTPTLDVALEVDNDSAFGSPKVVALAPQVAGGLNGTRIPLFFIPEGTDQRYLRATYTLGGTSPDYTLTAAIALADTTSD